MIFLEPFSEKINSNSCQDSKTMHEHIKNITKFWKIFYNFKIFELSNFVRDCYCDKKGDPYSSISQILGKGRKMNTLHIVRF